MKKIFFLVLMLTLILSVDSVSAVWWNFSWARCKNITFIADGMERVNFPMNASLTGLTFTSVDEVRVVDRPCNMGGNELKRNITSNTTTSIQMSFIVNNITTTTNVIYSVYYDNPNASTASTYYLGWDNFENGVVNTEWWWNSYPPSITISEANGVLQVNSTGTPVDYWGARFNVSSLLLDELSMNVKMRYSIGRVGVFTGTVINNYIAWASPTEGKMQLMNGVSLTNISCGSLPSNVWTTYYLTYDGTSYSNLTSGSNCILNGTAGLRAGIVTLSTNGVASNTEFDNFCIVSEKAQECNVYDIFPTVVLGSEETVIPLPKVLTVKLSGEFDYLAREDVKIRIAAIVKDKTTDEAVSDANVTIDVYDPTGIKIFSKNMTERIMGSGIYEVESSRTIRDLGLGKGVYLAHVKASYGYGPIATDIIEFHIDPPPSTMNFYLLLLLPIIVFVLIKLKSRIVF